MGRLQPSSSAMSLASEGRLTSIGSTAAGCEAAPAHYAPLRLSKQQTHDLGQWMQRAGVLSADVPTAESTIDEDEAEAEADADALDWPSAVLSHRLRPRSSVWSCT